MSAEMHEHESLPRQNARVTGAMGEHSLRLVDAYPPLDERTAATLQNMEQTYSKFTDAFGWNVEVKDELFDRIAGAQDEVSEELRKKMRELYFKSRSSSFLLDEKRANYKFIFEKFVHSEQPVAGVCLLARERGIATGDIDDLYVINHLLWTLSKMSEHEE